MPEPKSDAAARSRVPAREAGEVEEVLRSPGRPLDEPTRRAMESRLGHSFGDVVLHDDARATASARAIGAVAYTFGSHVVLPSGAADATTPRGRMLLAHELAHVVQTRGGGGEGSGDDLGVLEAAADHAAEAAAHPIAGRKAFPVAPGRTGPRLLRNNNPPVVSPGGAMQAMTPEDMYNKLIANRGFDEAIPVGQLDDVKKQLADMEAKLKTSPDPELQRQYNKLLSRYNISTFEGAGGAAGQGYNTYAVVQVVGPDGKIIAVADGKFTGGDHAEVIALKKIDAQLGGQTIPGSRIDVVGDKVVCPGCNKALNDFATKYDINRVDAHVFRRQKIVGQGAASEKTTARTATGKSSEGMTPTRSTQTLYSKPPSGTPTPTATGGSPGKTGGGGATLGKAAAAAAEHEPAEGKGGGVKGIGSLAHAGETGESVVGGAVKSAAKGALVSIGTGVALGIMQELFKQKVLDDLAKLPPPKIDARSSRGYYGDPSTKNGMRALDVLNKNLRPFAKDLETEHTKITSARFVHLAAVALMPEKTPDQHEKKLQQLDLIQGDLDAWEQQLLTIDDNLGALLDMEPALRKTAAAALDLQRILSSAVVANELLKMGFSFEEYTDIVGFLGNLAASIDRAIADARATKQTVRRLLNETAEFDHQVNRLWWDTFGGQLNALVKDRAEKERQAKQRSLQRAKARYGSLEGLDRPNMLNPDQMGMWYHYKSRESEILLELGELAKSAGSDPKAAERKLDLEAELTEVRKKMLQMKGLAD